MRLRRSVTTGIYAALIAIFAGTVVAAIVGVLNPQWAAAVSAAVPILATLLASAQRETDRRTLADTVDELAQQLAAQVVSDWTAEMSGRGLEPARRMRLRWRLAEGSNPGAQLAAEGLAGGGTLDQLTDRIRRDTDSKNKLVRLVVTGEMGGGKTAACVLLMVELAERHTVLPVLLQLATWDPATSLQAWIEQQLPEIFPVLRNGYGPEVAKTLASRHILPVLDGLDELRESAVALRAIDSQLSGRPFVLTCRTSEFTRANVGGALHQAVIVELQPLPADQVCDILLRYEPASVQGPLAPVAAMLEDQPTGQLAEALSTPFMVSLARDTGPSLAQLLPATAGADGADIIRRHLLGTFVRKAYANDEQITPDEARHYLRFLARHTDAAGRLAWWRLHLAVPRVVFLIVAVAVAGAACSGLAALFFALFNRPWLGFLIGLGAGVIGAFMVELVPQDDPRRARPRFQSVRVPTPHELARTIGFGFMGAAALAVMIWFLYEPPRYLIIGGVLSGITFTAARYLSQPNDPLKEVTPGSLLRADRAAVMYAWLVGTIPGAVTGAYLGFAFRAGHRSTFDSLGILSFSTPALALLGAAGGCVLSGAGLGLMAMGSSSWGRFIWTRLWLAARGSTPLRLMAFLQDAYGRGLLRQVNGYYEFRHRILQDYLAEPSPKLRTAPQALGPAHVGRDSPAR